MEAEAPAVLLYTSGTTGKPKGCVWTHVGFLGSMVTRDVHICGDFKSSDRYFFMSDMGWMVGAMCACIPSYFGASLLVAEGVPDYPEPDRFWRLVDDHRVSYLGVSPTLVRGLMRHGDAAVDARAFAALRIACSGGEAWTEAPWRWFFEHVCKRRVPIINITGGTEVGGCNFTGTVHHPLKPGSFGGPALGVGADIVDDAGRSVAPGQVGELVLRLPNIGMTKGLWRDPERYLASYWRSLPGVWVHGDFAMRDSDGLYYLLGRSDDTIKVAGKRTGPAEIESLLLATGRVSDAAVIGVADELTGSALRLRLRRDAGRRRRRRARTRAGAGGGRRHGCRVPAAAGGAGRRPAEDAQHEGDAPRRARGLCRQRPGRPVVAGQPRGARRAARAPAQVTAAAAPARPIAQTPTAASPHSHCRSISWRWILPVLLRGNAATSTRRISFGAL